MMSALWTPASSAMVPVCFMWRQGVMTIRSRPLTTVSTIKRGVPIAPSSISARTRRLIGSRR